MRIARARQRLDPTVMAPPGDGTPPQLHERLSVGSKTLSLDPIWTQPPIADIEFALLKNAAFPEMSRDTGLDHEFIIIDPSISPDEPSHEDLALRIAACAARLHIRTIVIGHESSQAFGFGGFPASGRALARTEGEAGTPGFAALRERIGWVLSTSRYSRRRQLMFPVCDAALYAIVVELLAELPAAARPFVHLATWWDEAAMPNRGRFPGLDRIGSAIQELNGTRATTFLYAWTRPLAQRLSSRFGVPVAPLETPPELTLAGDGDQLPDSLTVGYFSAPTRENGFDVLPTIIRSANEAAGNARKLRFVVQIRPEPGGASLSDDSIATRAEIAAMPQRSRSLLDEFLPRESYFAALRQVDAVLLPHPDGTGERHSATVLDAMAAGKVVFALDPASFAGAVRNRVLSASDPQALGELIAQTATDLPAVRTASKIAKATYWATLRPSRMFAQLLYGPMILDEASGTAAI